MKSVTRYNMKLLILITMVTTFWAMIECRPSFAKYTRSDLDLYPAPLVHMNDFYSHHVFVAEKSTHELHLFENDKSYPKLLKTYQMVSGKQTGDKQSQGDYKTPEGIYSIVHFIPREKLLKKYGKAGEIYGVGSFVMNYPNPIDLKEGKTGGGIWIHSTNDETRIDKGLDSRGCIVTANNNLKEISKYIELKKTNVIIVQSLHYLKKNTWELNRTSLDNLVDAWLKAWAKKDFKEYISHYHPQKYQDPIRRNYDSFYNYKKAVFSNNDRIKIQTKNLSILQAENYAMVTFTQFYQSSKINDVGIKTLYLQKDDSYTWKIVSEVWSKADFEFSPKNDNVNFKPSMRFFSNITETNKQVL